MLILIVLNT